MRLPFPILITKLCLPLSSRVAARTAIQLQKKHHGNMKKRDLQTPNDEYLAKKTHVGLGPVASKGPVGSGSGGSGGGGGGGGGVGGVGGGGASGKSPCRRATVDVEVVIDGGGVESPGTLTMPRSASVAEVIEKLPHLRKWARTLVVDGQEHSGQAMIGTLEREDGSLYVYCCVVCVTITIVCVTVVCVAVE